MNYRVESKSSDEKLLVADLARYFKDKLAEYKSVKDKSNDMMKMMKLTDPDLDYEEYERNYKKYQLDSNKVKNEITSKMTGLPPKVTFHRVYMNYLNMDDNELNKELTHPKVLELSKSGNPSIGKVPPVGTKFIAGGDEYEIVKFGLNDKGKYVGVKNLSNNKIYNYPIGLFQNKRKSGVVKILESLFAGVNTTDESFLEATRNELINKARSEDPRRYNDRMQYRPTSFEGVNIKELFENDNLVFTTRVGNYINILAIEGVLTALKNEVGHKNKCTYADVLRVVNRQLDQDGLRIRCDCPDFCLTGDTRISLLDGRELSILEIVEEFNKGKELWVFSTDENGDFKPGLITDAWLTGQSDNIYRITLDNGESVTCTGNHPFMLRDGSYKNAQDLEVGQSLMPMYFKTNSKGYRDIHSNTELKSWYSTYRQVANELLKDQIEEAKLRTGEDVIVIHHLDFDKQNNDPSNLYPMGRVEHWIYHSTYVKESGRMDKFLAKGKEYWSSQEARDKQAEVCRSVIKNWWTNLSEEEYQEYLHKRWDGYEISEESRRRMSEARKRFFDSMTREERSEYTRRLINSPEAIKKAGISRSRTMKSQYASGEREVNEGFVNYSKGPRSEEWRAKCSEWMSEANRLRMSDHKYASRISKKGYQTRVIKILQEMVQEGLPITQESYESYKAYKKPKWYKQFDSWEEVEERYKSMNYNHRVLSIEKLEGAQDVYDITVDQWHNFRLSIGVIVSNTYRYAHWAYKGGYLYGDPGKAIEPPRYDRTNKDGRGSMCKHLASTIARKEWIVKVAAGINNYIRVNLEECAPYLFDDPDEAIRIARNRPKIQLQPEPEQVQEPEVDAGPSISEPDVKDDSGGFEDNDPYHQLDNTSDELGPDEDALNKANTVGTSEEEDEDEDI